MYILIIKETNKGKMAFGSMSKQENQKGPLRINYLYQSSIALVFL